MKRTSMFALVSLLCSPLYAARVIEPNPYAVQSLSMITVQLRSMREQLNQDAIMFRDDHTHTMATLSTQLDTLGTQRNTTFSLIRAKFAELENQVAQGIATIQQETDQGNLDLAALQQELATINDTATHDFNTIRIAIDALVEQIHELQQAIATIHDLNENQLRDIIEQLNGIVSNYTALTDARTEFITAFEGFIKTLTTYAEEDLLAVQEIADDLCPSPTPEANAQRT